LEENCCFDAEVYADEADIKEKLEFKDDQRSMFHTPIYLDMADS
jgi:hypothetical protein